MVRAKSVMGIEKHSLQFGASHARLESPASGVEARGSVIKKQEEATPRNVSAGYHKILRPTGPQDRFWLVSRVLA